MALDLLSTNSTTQWVTNTANDTWVVAEGVYLTVNGTAILGTGAVLNRKFQIDGHVFGEGAGSGLFIGASATTGGSSTILIGDTGSVYGENNGIAAIGGDLNLQNHGMITGANVGLSIDGDGNHVFNTGEISSWSGDGLVSDGVGANIINKGTIAGTTNGVLLEGDVVYFCNNGLVITTSDSFSDAAVNMKGSNADFLNVGQILADLIAVLGDEGNQSLTNKGQIAGWVDLGGGDDSFGNRGDMFGTIDLGDGDDSFVSRKGICSDSVFGGVGDDRYTIDDADIELIEGADAGTDTVQSFVSYRLRDNFEVLFLKGQANLTARGNDSDNRLTGNVGSNQIFALAGNDLIFGDVGADRIDGGTGLDWVSYENSENGVIVNLATGKAYGGWADGDRLISVEKLIGSDFKDVLVGSKSANFLSGHSGGNDRLTGLGGKDTFEFNDANAPNNVTVTDFIDGVDRIDIADWAIQHNIDTLAEVKALSTNVGNDLVIDFSSILAGNSLKLLGVQRADLSASDFIFVG